MYQYDTIDRQLVQQRVDQFRDQTRRFLDGEITDQEFLPLRLQNGLYIQRLAPMLRIAVPYGMLSSRQVRKLGHIARTYDKGYAHFTTRQNIQLNWPNLEEVPDILAELAEVEMHAIQTSGNCIRNVTSDEFASPPMRSKTPVPGVKLSASGPPSTRNLPFCRASSRSPSAALNRTARRSRYTISGCKSSKMPTAKPAFASM